MSVSLGTVLILSSFRDIRWLSFCIIILSSNLSCELAEEIEFFECQTHWDNCIIEGNMSTLETFIIWEELWSNSKITLLCLSCQIYEKSNIVWSKGKISGNGNPVSIRKCQTALYLQVIIIYAFNFYFRNLLSEYTMKYGYR